MAKDTREELWARMVRAHDLNQAEKASKKRRTALHEASHAVVAKVLGGRFEAVNVVPGATGQGGGAFTTHDGGLVNPDPASFMDLPLVGRLTAVAGLVADQSWPPKAPSSADVRGLARVFQADQRYASDANTYDSIERGGGRHLEGDISEMHRVLAALHGHVEQVADALVSADTLMFDQVTVPVATMIPLDCVDHEGVARPFYLEDTGSGYDHDLSFTVHQRPIVDPSAQWYEASFKLIEDTNEAQVVALENYGMAHYRGKGIAEAVFQHVTERGHVVVSSTSTKTHQRLDPEDHSALARKMWVRLVGVGMAHFRDVDHRFEFTGIKPVLLWHYTALEHLPKILASGGLWNVAVCESGDDDEMQVALSLVQVAVDELLTVGGRTVDKVARDLWRTHCVPAVSPSASIGITCLTDSDDVAALWNYPSPEAPTVAVCIRTAEVLVAARSLDPAARLVRCEADPGAQQDRVAEVLWALADASADASDISPSLSAIQGLMESFVYPGFGGEREWRVVLDQDVRGASGEVLIKPVCPVAVRLQTGFDEEHDLVETALAQSGVTSTQDGNLYTIG